MSGEEFAVELMQFLMFIMGFIGSLCILGVIADALERHERKARPKDVVAERHRKIRCNGFKSKAGIR